jgi:hypothetical protein
MASFVQTEPPEDEAVLNSRGDLILALKYVPAVDQGRKERRKKGTLMLLVKEAKNLPVVRHTLPDPYCKW